MPLSISKETIKKYDVPGPRYTSYPTAPTWNQDVTETTYQQKLKAFGKTNKTLSVYVHIPFCQSMCTFCACSVIIRRHDRKYGDEYLDYLSKEIDLIGNNIGRRMPVKQFHWGGGTPTFLEDDQLQTLFWKFNKAFDIDLNGEIAIEIDPRTTDKNTIKILRSLGFNRISFGVQDFNVEVQKSVNRIQPYELVKDVYEWCRSLKFYSINFDLIYGLPHQNEESFKDTVDKVIEMRPDRIALYSFAYLPSIKRHQQKINIDDLPSSDRKLNIFLQAQKQFLEGGYQAIAMDHFALKDDELAKSFNAGSLYRNFMGYTVKPADEFVGFGVTSIGFLENLFIQNHKILKDYYADITAGKLPVERGLLLSKDDQIRKWIIHSLMCRFQINTQKFKDRFHCDFNQYFAQEQPHIKICLEDQLLVNENDVFKVTELGKIFIRNICMGFDCYLRQKNSQTTFSKTI